MSTTFFGPAHDRFLNPPEPVERTGEQILEEVLDHCEGDLEDLLLDTEFPEMEDKEIASRLRAMIEKARFRAERLAERREVG